MTKFTTRVVLHAADEEKYYEQLHTAMGGQGFSRTIQDGDGIDYDLPHAEYNISGNFSKETVINRAKVAARKVKSVADDNDFSILVTQSAGRIFHNLDET